MNLSSFHKLFILSAVILTVTVAPNMAVCMDSVFEEEKKEVKQGISKYRINIRRLQQGIKHQREEIEKSLQQERNLLAEIEDIDTRLQEQLDKITVLEERMTNQKNLISIKEKELDRAKSERHAVKAHLESRISAYYKMGRIGVINVAFSSQTLPELLQFHDSFQSLLKYDKSVMDTYRHTIEEIEKAKSALLIEQTLLEDFIQQALVEKQNIDVIRQEKETLLTHIKSQTNLHKQAILEMEKASRELTSSLTVLESKEKFLEQGFLLHKGRMPTPVEGKVITHFQEATQNRMGIKKRSSGISIDAANRSKIKAIYDGTVIFAGYHRGYGNTVIVHHGHKYFSIISRIEKIIVKKSDKVKTGDIIGIAGDTATLIENGIYLEIRQQKQSLDPLDWIDHTNLIISR